MTTILVSSADLAAKLKKFKFPNEYIERVSIKDQELWLHSREKSVGVPCETRETSAEYFQEEVLWRLMFKTLSAIEEQPITMNIYNNRAEVILQF